MSISVLPLEILRLILLETVKAENGRPSTTASRYLLGVCFQWRNLVETTSGFWTSISIEFKGNRDPTYAPPTRNPNQYLASLDVQLQRAKSQLIDIYASIYVDGDLAGPLFSLILRRAPFHRWRTLDIYDFYWDNYTLPITRKDDGFVNLEYMKIRNYCKPEFLSLVDRTATSKLTVFNWNLSFQKLRQTCPNIFPNGRSDAHLSPPPNVVNLTLPFPLLNNPSHIVHLKLTRPQYIKEFINYDWTNLVSLDFTVTGSQPSFPTNRQIISFPRLETLAIRGINYIALSCFSAPWLRDLQFSKNYKRTGHAVTRLEEALLCPSFTLSPSGVTEVLFPLDNRTLTTLVHAFPKTKTLKLLFHNDDNGWEAIRTVFCDWKNTTKITVKTEIEAASSRSMVFTGQLTCLDLHLNCDYKEGMREIWRARMMKVLENTQCTSLNKIRCTWSGRQPIELDRSDLDADNGVPKTA
ncbi:hypothetical protein FRC18_003963 [Serendipita sp. 400]|nr:hypothetical protein FRC18_003963 [Serendipita sp. 400]